MNKKQIHKSWVAAARMNEPGSGEALSSSGALLKPGPWSNEITELEHFFMNVKLPVEPIRIDKCSQVTNVALFIKSHLGIVKAQNGNERYTPYLDRLRALKHTIELN